ncbi:unnamed protein product [Musa acuminata subsp. malaccensis]|nr:unnamed protein product [Musa acuminata subsp. malaccensis]
MGEQGLPGDRKRDGDKKDRKFEPAAPPSRVGRKQCKQKGPEDAARLPVVTLLSKCRLRLLKLERVKNYPFMEEEFVANQERLRPQEEKNEEDRSKVDDLRGSPMSVGNLEELIDERSMPLFPRRSGRSTTLASCPLSTRISWNRDVRSLCIPRSYLLLGFFMMKLIIWFLL